MKKTFTLILFALICCLPLSVAAQESMRPQLWSIGYTDGSLDCYNANMVTEGNYEAQVLIYPYQSLPNESSEVQYISANYWIQGEPYNTYTITYTPIDDKSTIVNVSLTNSDNLTSNYKITCKYADYLVSITWQGFQGFINTEINDNPTYSGLYMAGDKVKLTAMPNENYVFDHWEKLNQETYTYVSYSDESTIVFENANEDINVRALFKVVNGYTINAKVLGNGNVHAEIPNEYGYSDRVDFYDGEVGLVAGTEVTFVYEDPYIPNPNDQFAGWALADGTIVSTDKQYTVTLSEDIELIAQVNRVVNIKNGWATYCDENYDKSYTVEGGTAYWANYVAATESESAYIELIPFDGAIAGYEGIIINSESSQVTIKYQDNQVEQNWENRLSGMPYETNLNDSYGNVADWNFYALYNSATPVTFRKYTGVNVPANKAILAIYNTTYSAAPLRVVIGSEATGIEIIDSEELNANESYDIMGRKTNASEKGLMIKNGKVIFNK